MKNHSENLYIIMMLYKVDLIGHQIKWYMPSIDLETQSLKLLFITYQNECDSET